MTPNGTETLMTNRNRPMVCADRSGRVYVSDTTLVGLLLALGFDPVSDVPTVTVEGRSWWCYAGRNAEGVMHTYEGYYLPHAGDSGFSLVRRAAECARTFAHLAKCGSGVNAERGKS